MIKPLSFSSSQHTHPPILVPAHTHTQINVLAPNNLSFLLPLCPPSFLVKISILNYSSLLSEWVFPSGSDSRESTCNVGDLGSTPGLVRSPGGGHGNPLQYSYLENPHGQRSLMGYSPWGLKVRHNWAPKHTQQRPHFRSQRLGSWCHVWSGVKYKQLWRMLLRQLGKYGYVDTCFRICLMVLTLMLWLWWRQLSS